MVDGSLFDPFNVSTSFLQGNVLHERLLGNLIHVAAHGELRRASSVHGLLLFILVTHLCKRSMNLPVHNNYACAVTINMKNIPRKQLVDAIFKIPQCVNSL